MKRARKLYWRRVLIAISFVAGVALVGLATMGIFDYFVTTKTGDDRPSASVVEAEGTVSERRPVIDESYTVPAGQPRLISIPSIDIEAYVQRVGVMDNNIMASPSNIFFTGWYIRSAIPGESGVSIVNGHAGGRYEQGVFRNVKQLSIGDVINVQMGDLSWRAFNVQSVNTYDLEDAAAPLYADDPSIENELHLITCDGSFDDTTQTYDQRIIVVAKGE